MQNQRKINPYEKEILVIKSHIHKWVKEHGFKCDRLTARAVNDAVIHILERAVERAKLTKMKTIKPRHI